jgi:hypothetical protein
MASHLPPQSRPFDLVAVVEAECLQRGAIVSTYLPTGTELGRLNDRLGVLAPASTSSNQDTQRRLISVVKSLNTNSIPTFGLHQRRMHGCKSGLPGHAYPNGISR